MSKILSRRSFLVAAAAIPFWTACASGALPVPTATPAPAGAQGAGAKPPAEPTKPAAAEPTKPAAPAPTTAPTTAPAAPTTAPAAAATSAPAAAAATKPAEAAKPAAAAPAAGGAAGQITWWHHWVTEESKKKVINQFIDEYQKEKPNTKITIRYWEKAEMYPVARNAMTAGKDFPDIMYGPEDPFITAGWVEDLTNVLDWSQLQEGAKDRTVRSVAGKAGVWEGPLESGSEEIYYNPKIFDKVGIKVPDDKQLSSDEMLDAATKLRAGGFDPLAQGIGDRAYPGANLSTYSLLSAVGPDDYKALVAGKKEWTDPAVKSVLEWVAKMAKVPAMPASFATMNLAESHQYFHTPAQGKDLPRAGMFWIGAFYPGRAFVPPEKGGQPADFRLSFMKYPTFAGGKGTGYKIGGGGSGAGAVISLSKQKDVGLDIAKSFMNVKYGSLWLGLTYVPTELKTDPKQMPAGQYQWYAEEFAKTHQGQKYVTLNVATPPPLAEALKAALNEGLPQGQLSVDKAIEVLEKGRTAK